MVTWVSVVILVGQDLSSLLLINTSDLDNFCEWLRFLTASIGTSPIIRRMCDNVCTSKKVDRQKKKKKLEMRIFIFFKTKDKQIHEKETRPKEDYEPKS